jgi:hypothetical protein
VDDRWKVTVYDADGSIKASLHQVPWVDVLHFLGQFGGSRRTTHSIKIEREK